MQHFVNYLLIICIWILSYGCKTSHIETEQEWLDSHTVISFPSDLTDKKNYMITSFDELMKVAPEDYWRIIELRVEDWHHKIPADSLLKKLYQLKNLRFIHFKKMKKHVPRKIKVDFSKLPNILEVWAEDGLDQEYLNSLAQCKRLRHLRMERCTIDSLPSTLADLKNLTTLILKSTRLKFPDNFGDLHLTKLVFAGGHVPLSTWNIETLEELEIHSMRFKEDRLPKEVGKLKNLKKLKFAGVFLIELSPEFGELESLRELELRDVSGLRYFPDEVAKLNMLKSFKVVRTPLYEFPKFESDSLERVELIRTLTRSFPSNIKKLKNLKTLIVKRCPMNQIPPEIKELTGLRSLYIDFLGANKNNLKLPYIDYQSLLGLDSIRSIRVDFIGDGDEEAEKALKSYYGDRYWNRNSRR